MRKKLMTLLLLCAAMVPAMAQEELSHILIYKVDGTVDSLLLNNVRDVYHSRADENGVEQPDISTLRLRTIDSEVVYLINEVDHVVMPKTGRFISFMGTADHIDDSANSTTAHAPRRTSVSGDFQQAAGEPFRYNWVSGDYIWLSTGVKSNSVQLSSTNTNSNGRFSFNNDLLEDKYVVYYSGTNNNVYNKVTIPTTQTQTAANNSDHLGASGDCGVATATRERDSHYNFALDHKTPILCFMPRVDSLKTLQLEHVALKADKTIAGTYTLSADGITLDDGTGSDTITLRTNHFLLPQLKVNAQDSAASYIVVAPQTEKTTFKLYYRVKDSRSKLDTIIVKNVWWDKLEPAKLYPVNSKIPVRTFLRAYTDSCKWDFGEKATLYGALNLPVEDFGFWWGYNKNLTNETKEEEIKLTKSELTDYPEYQFSNDAVNEVKQKAYYYRAFAREGGRLLLGQVKKFGMEREIINMGTKVRWSSINMGAITAEDYGDYYAWGELEPKDPKNYSRATYNYYDNGNYVDIGSNIAGNPAYDAATAKWRSCWRMPTMEEMEQLKTCTWEPEDRTDEKGNTVSGYLIKNKNQLQNPDSTIFIPKGGYYNGTNLYSTGGYAELWTGTLSPTDPAKAYYYYNSIRDIYERCYGFPIRPVFESNIETSDGKYLFTRTDSISYSADHTSTNMYGTTRGLDDVVTDLTQGFVIGTTEDVELNSESLRVTLTQKAVDNGSYHIPLTKEQMNQLAFGDTYYVRSYLTYGEGENAPTWYGDPQPMLAMTIQTDSTNWAVGKTSARLCGAAGGITEAAKSSVDIGFVIGTTDEVKLGMEGAIEIVCDSTVNNKFVCEFNNIDFKQYFFRAFIRQGGRVSYGDPMMLGLEFVDLGLPSKTRWANINLGAQTPADNGDYYAWGEINPRASYTSGNYNYSENKGTDIAGTKFDAAQMNWQGPWRLPTKADEEELYDSRYCTWEAVPYFGKNVYKVTSKINGKCIYIPRAGYKENSTVYSNDDRFTYWTSTLNGTDATNSNTGAWIFDNYTSGNDKRFMKPYSHSRFFGFSIRPVALVNDTLQDNTMIQLSTDSVQWSVGQTTATVYGYQLGLRYHSDEQREVGFVWSTEENIHAINDDTELPAGVTKYIVPVQSEVGIVKNGILTADITGIEDGTVYYYRAYAKVNGKYYFAEERQFGRCMVDLGLSSGLLWSNINLGASSPDDGGDYYAWGETSTKSNYSTANYTYADYGTDISGSSHDAAHVNWGGLWRMPTKNDLEELLTECTWTEVTKYGQPMYKVEGPNHQSIYIAKRGYMNGTTLADEGNRAATWTSVMNDQQSTSNEKAFGGSFYGTSRNIEAIGRHLGYTVRPVVKWNKQDNDVKFYVSTDSTDWYVGNAAPRLCGSVFVPAGTTVTARGFVVGYKSKIADVETPNFSDNEVTNVTGASVSVDAVDDNIFRGSVAYTKDTTYYYRAYVTIGENTYFGEPRRYGLEIVDLGFGIKWASLNVGAQISSEYGNRYAWGETTANKSSYTRNTYDYYSNGYQDIGSDISYKSTDAVKAAWTGSNKWRMPTQAEINALLDEENCTWEWTTLDGQAGYKVTSKIEGYTDKSIFLPAAGYQEGSFYKNIGEDCYYWSSTHYDGGFSYYLHGNSTTHAQENSIERCYGFAIRPVSTVGTTQGGGGDITGGHNPGGSSQTGGSGSGSGGHEDGNIGGVIGN